MKFRKKPVVINAFQWSPEAPASSLPPWFTSRSNWDLTGDKLTIRTLEGDMVANHGDWIIMGVKGELYPCRDDIFAATYERAE